MNVSIGRELEDYIQQKVATGDYASASEVVREGLRLLKDRERSRDAEIEAIRKTIEEAWQQSETGPFLDGPAVMEEIRQRIEAKRARRDE